MTFCLWRFAGDNVSVIGWVLVVILCGLICVIYLWWALMLSGLRAFAYVLLCVGYVVHDWFLF